MSLIQSCKYFPSSKADAKPVLLMCGFGGAIWQTRRLISQLTKAGYNVTALDFPKKVLSDGNPDLLPELVEEVVRFAEEKAKESDEEILLIGISLGSLLSLNILRRSKLFSRAVMVTGGNIVTVAQHIFGRKIWPQTHEELSQLWSDVNIWSDPLLLKNKRMLFVLPHKDKLIDTSEVLQEIERQTKAGNSLTLVTRKNFGHIGTIVEETVVFPKRVLGYIGRL